MRTLSETERVQAQTVAEWLHEYVTGEIEMKAPSGNSDGFDIPEGLHAAVCSMVVDCGVWSRTGKWGEKKTHEIYLRWILPNCIIPDGEYAGEPAAVGSRYSFSMFKKANLRKDLETWRGRPFSDTEADAFDVDKIIGAQCNLQLYTSDAGYTNIQLITPYSGPRMKGAAKPIVFDTMNPGNFDALPDWVQKKIQLPTQESVADQQEYGDVLQQQTDFERQSRSETPVNTGRTFDDESNYDEDFDDRIPF